MARSQRDMALKLDRPQVFTWRDQNRVACRGRLQPLLDGGEITAGGPEGQTVIVVPSEAAMTSGSPPAIANPTAIASERIISLVSLPFFDVRTPK